MANNNFKKAEGNFKLVVSRELESKIRYMCSISPDNEWSGVLFYTVSGEFNRSNPLVATAIDFCLCDVGSSTYTEFETKPEVVTYMCNNDLLGCYMGLIHSHDKMSTFFSGTDLNTLEAEGKSMPHFLSLIVNNDGRYTAAITKKVQRTFRGIYEDTLYSFNGLRVNSTPEDYTTVNDCVFYHMMDIVVEGGEFYDSLKKRFDELSKSKDVTKKGGFGNNTLLAWNGWNSDATYSNSFRDYEDHSIYKNSFTDTKTKNPTPTYKQGELFEDDIIWRKKNTPKKNSSKEYHITEKEIVKLLKNIFGDSPKKKKGLEALIADMNKRYLKDMKGTTDILDENIDVFVCDCCLDKDYDDEAYLGYISYVAGQCLAYLNANFGYSEYKVLHVVDDMLSDYLL